jgi:hypothetical protein
MQWPSKLILPGLNEKDGDTRASILTGLAISWQVEQDQGLMKSF